MPLIIDYSSRLHHNLPEILAGESRIYQDPFSFEDASVPDSYGVSAHAFETAPFLKQIDFHLSG